MKNKKGKFGGPEMVETEAILTCPHCGKSYQVIMPVDYCQIRLVCPECQQTITPKDGDCCIFCSFADKPCPPKQKSENENEFSFYMTT
jgi:hypothetical protein